MHSEFNVAIMEHLLVVRVQHHPRWGVKQGCWWNMRHGVGKTAELISAVSETTIDVKLAGSSHHEILAQLGLVVAVKDTDVLLPREVLGQGIIDISAFIFSMGEAASIT